MKRLTKAPPDHEASGILLTAALVIVAALLTESVQRLTGDFTSVFYLSAAVIATWNWGPVCGAIVVISGSLLTVGAPLDDATSAQIDEPDAWMHVAVLVATASVFGLLIRQVQNRDREVRRSLGTLQTVLDLAPVGIAIADGATPPREIRVNTALASMLGTASGALNVDSEAIRNLTFRDGDQGLALTDLPLHVVLSSRRPSAKQHIQVVRQPGDQPVHIQAQGVPLLEDHTVIGAIATYVDVTEAHMREEQLRRANRAKDEFLGMVSHELKTPLTIIAGNADVLDRLWPEPDTVIREAFEDLQGAARQLLRNVDNLLALSRLGSKRLEIEPISVHPLLARVAASHGKAGHRINVECDRLVALGTEPIVEQVLDNLVTNAEKYSTPTEPIEIAASATDEEVQVVVRDRGLGLDDDEYELVFTPFYRSRRTNPAIGGMGIGLSVCRQLIAAMGGRLWAMPRDGGGSEFVFSLPRLRDDA